MVGESGLFTPADIAYVQEAGVKAVSIGNCLTFVICWLYLSIKFSYFYGKPTFNLCTVPLWYNSNSHIMSPFYLFFCRFWSESLLWNKVILGRESAISLAKISLWEGNKQSTVLQYYITDYYKVSSSGAFYICLYHINKILSAANMYQNILCMFLDALLQLNYIIFARRWIIWRQIVCRYSLALHWISIIHHLKCYNPQVVGLRYGFWY